VSYIRYTVRPTDLSDQVPEGAELTAFAVEYRDMLIGAFEAAGLDVDVMIDYGSSGGRTITGATCEEEDEITEVANGVFERLC
jgi:predicted peptidase